MIIERGGLLLGMMLMKLSRGHISIGKPFSQFFQWHRGIQNSDSSRGMKDEYHMLHRVYGAPFD
jgi:hypothetical protein